MSRGQTGQNGAANALGLCISVGRIWILCDRALDDAPRSLRHTQYHFSSLRIGELEPPQCPVRKVHYRLSQGSPCRTSGNRSQLALVQKEHENGHMLPLTGFSRFGRAVVKAVTRGLARPCSQFPLCRESRRIPPPAGFLFPTFLPRVWSTLLPERLSLLLCKAAPYAVPPPDTSKRAENCPGGLRPR